MLTFFEKLDRRAKEIDSLLCVGLDPHLEDLPERSGAAARDFCLRLIEATAPFALAYKPNAAFFEALGPAGWEALQVVIRAVPERIPVILDAKRGDIASTARAYARSAFTELGADAITLSPYLGADSLTPFLEDPEKGVFLLCKTSNPGSGDLQDLSLGASCDHRMVYEQVAGLAAKWDTGKQVGLVVGATYPEALQRIRQIAPAQWFLAPGLGAQGADLQTAMQAGLRQDGLGMLINVSRGISRAEDPHQAAHDLVERLRSAQKRVNPQQQPQKQIEAARLALAEGLFSMGCVQFGEFTLKSGLISPVYIDLRRLVSFPDWLSRVAAVYCQQLSELSFDRIAGLPYAALSIATAVSLQSRKPMIYPRKTTKAYGTAAEIEGIYHQGETVVVLDDLATTGSSKFEAIEKLQAAGLLVRDVVVLIDRESGAKQALAAQGIHMHALLTLSQLLDILGGVGKLAEVQMARVRAFLQETGGGG